MGKLSNLQILRGCAALMIVIYHCGIEASEAALRNGQAMLFNYHPWGNGVPLFFAISGFIMIATCYDSFGKSGASVDFLKRRIIRIVPLYWMLTTLALVASLLLPNLMKMPVFDGPYVLASYLFWPAIRSTGDIRPLVTPGWTLNLEMMFYVVFAVALLFPRRVGIALTGAVLTVLCIAHVSGIAGGTLLTFWGDPIVLGFVFGIGIGWLFKMGFRLSPAVAMVVMGVGTVLLFHPRLSGFAENDIAVRLADAIPCAILLAGAMLGPQVDVARYRLLMPALWVGDASYSLYLVHEFGLRPLRLAWTAGIGSSVSLWLFVAAGVALSLALAFATYWLFERPVTNWLNRAAIKERPDTARFQQRIRQATG